MKHWGWINFILTAMKSKYTQNCGILNGKELLFKMVFVKKLKDKYGYAKG